MTPQEIEELKYDRDALAAKLEKIKAAWLAAASWPNTVKERQRIGDAIASVPQQCLRDVKAQAVEWAMNKLRAEYEAHPLLNYSAFAITQHIEAQSKQYVATVRQGGE